MQMLEEADLSTSAEQTSVFVQQTMMSLRHVSFSGYSAQQFASHLLQFATVLSQSIQTELLSIGFLQFDNQR